MPSAESMTTSIKVVLAAVVVGAAFGALGLAVGGPFIALAVVSFGGAAIVAGLDSVVTRRHQSGWDESSNMGRMHTGASAVMFGFTFLGVGVVLVVAGAASLVGWGDELWAWVADRPGIGAMIIGAWIAVIGIALVISRWTYLRASTVWWQRVPSIVLGLFLIVAGIVVVAIGWSLWNDPLDSDDVWQRTLDTLARWLGG